MNDINENMEENKKNANLEPNIDRPTEQGADSHDRLSAVKKLVAQANRDAEARISERERSVKESEIENERRLTEAKAKIADFAERQERLANERVARIEYSGEYRQRLMARENKRAAEEKRRRQEARAEQTRLKEEERAKEIEEFVRREKEASAKRAAETEKLFSAVSKPVSVENFTEEQPFFSDTVKEDTEAQEQALDNTQTAQDSFVKDDGRILLEIGPNSTVCEKDDENENVIHIGGAQYHASIRPYQNAPAYSSFDREIEKAQKQHAELRLAGVAKASGVYREEIRLLEEEELRYNREIAEIQAKRMEYAEHREYMSAAAESFGAESEKFDYVLSDESTKPYDEFSDSRIMSERLNAEDELSEYEKYRQESDRYRQDTPPFAANGSRESDAMEYGCFEPEQVAPTAYAEPYTEYLYSENEYEKFDPAVARYEESLEAKQLAESQEKEDEPNDKLIAYHLQNADGFAKAALLKKLGDYRRAEAALTKRIKKLTARQNSVSGEEKTVLIVEKIGIRKEITELAVEALTACVYASAKFKTITYKRVLVSQINAYNAVCDEYEMHTGRPLVRLSIDMATEVAEGKICDPIPNVYYYGSESFGVRDDVGVSIEEERGRRMAEESALEEAEFHRLLNDNYSRELTRTEIRERDKRQAEKMSAIKRATERDLLLIGLRQDYRIARLEYERDMLLHSFSTDKKKKDKRLRAIERKIGKTRSEIKRSVKLERGNNSRYYLLSAMAPESEKTKKRANRERLSALKMRLEILLSEREEINERLIALYGGTDKKLTKTKINRKAGGVRKKHAKATYRKQRSIANRIERIKAPLDMKEKAYALLNKKTACVATIEECYYKLRRLKPTGRAKRELLSDIRRAKAVMRTIDSDVKFLIKKMKRHEQRREDDRRHAWFIVFFVLLAIGCVALWYFYSEDVLAYFTELFQKLGIK